MSMPTGGAQITLPAGATIAGSRETTKVNAEGRALDGQAFTIRLPKGTTTTVFVPYDLMGSTEAVQQLIDERIAGITSITG